MWIISSLLAIPAFLLTVVVSTLLLIAFAFVVLSLTSDDGLAPTEVPLILASPTSIPEPTPEPTAEPTQIPEPTPIPPTPTPPPLAALFTATRYGESYNGQPLGCGGAGLYSSGNPTILAAPPTRYKEWPCGTVLQLCYQGRCLEVTRVDSCPGCGHTHIDLSESGIAYLCGWSCDIIVNGVEVTILSHSQARSDPLIDGLTREDELRSAIATILCQRVAIREARCR